MQKKIKIKNMILKSIAMIVSILFLASAEAITYTTSSITIYALLMFGCLALLWLFCIANNFFWGRE